MERPPSFFDSIGGPPRVRWPFGLWRGRSQTNPISLRIFHHHGIALATLKRLGRQTSQPFRRSECLIRFLRVRLLQKAAART
jgi:hypothetical protein